MEASKAVYKQVIGEEPKSIVDPKEIEKMFPKSLESATEYAEKNSYSLQAARHNLKAKKYDEPRGIMLWKCEIFATTFKLSSIKYGYDSKHFVKTVMTAKDLDWLFAIDDCQEWCDGYYLMSVLDNLKKFKKGNNVNSLSYLISIFSQILSQ